MIGCFSPWQMLTPASPPTSATRNGSKYIDQPHRRPHSARCLRAQLQGFIKQGKFPNLVFHGLPGIGKTSAAINLCKVVDVDVFRVRADTDRGIDRVRQIMDFATTVAFSGGGKVVIMEEGNLLDARSARGPSQPHRRMCVELRVHFYLQRPTKDHSGASFAMQENRLHTQPGGRRRMSAAMPWSEVAVTFSTRKASSTTLRPS